MISRNSVETSLQELRGAPRGTARQQSPKYPSAEKIVATFNTWAFKREQPSGLDLLIRSVERAVLMQRQVEFVLYWGKGPRMTVANPDRECLDYLAQVTKRICAFYAPGAVMRLIQTDTHAALNGHAPQVINSYFGGIEVEAAARGFTVCRLGDLVQANAAAEVGTPPVVPAADTLENLVRSATRWYRGGGDIAAGAARYYQMNMVEKRAVEAAFPASVFVTFNGSEFRELFPDNLPVFYMYSLRKGYGVKPWFLDEAGTPFEAATPTVREASASAA